MATCPKARVVVKAVFYCCFLDFFVMKSVPDTCFCEETSIR